MNITLIEKETVERDYGFDGVNAIVDCEKNGRLLIMDGFGGMDTAAGGAVRFRHGMAVKLAKGDTLQALESADWNEGTSHMSAILQGYDKNRPILNWGGFVIDKIAKTVGL